MKRFKVGIIGFGYWGPNVVRNFNNHVDCEVEYICDINQQAIDRAKEMYPTISIVNDTKILFEDKKIDIIGIITPLKSHFQLAKQALEAGKHIFLEKPMTETITQGKTLINLANKKKLVGVVDHTFLFTGAVKKIKDIIDSGEIGEMIYFDSVRVNLGLFQQGLDVIWDLVPHDLSILLYLLEKRPIALSANGVDHLNNGFVDIAYLSFHYKNKMIANFHVNWLSPVKVRKILIGGTKKMIVYDDMQTSEKVKVYDKGIKQNTINDIHQILVKYRSGDMWAPNISHKEALESEVEDFIQQVKNNITESINDLYAGLEIVSLLERSKEILNKNILLNIK